MRKSKKIFVTLCLATAFLGAGAFTACDFDNKEPDSGSNVETSTEIEYKVNFDTVGGSTVKAQYVKKGDKVVKPEDPTRAGYTFVEWQLNRNSYDFETAVTNNITLTAKWIKNEPTKFTVNFIVDGETVDTKEVADGKKVSAPVEVPTREGYVFDGWALEDVAYDFETPVTGNISLIAQWANAWTVTFDTSEGTEVDPVIVKEGDAVVAPETTKDGYYVVGWLLEGKSYDFEEPIMSDITLTAVWKAVGLTSKQISIISNGWDVSDNEGYLDVVTGNDGEMTVTTIFSGSNTCYSALVLRNLFSKEYYEKAIAGGDARLVFKLAVDGELSDLYVFGKELSSYWCKDGVYTVSVDLQYIVDNYATIGTLGYGKDNQAYDTDLSQMMIAWKNEATVWGNQRNYVFTISNVKLKPAIEFNMDFANENSDFIEVGGTTVLTVTTNLDGEIEWKSSNEAVATVQNGVVTGIRGGMVTIFASVEGEVKSKTVYVAPDRLYADQIGCRVNGYDMTGNESYFKMEEGLNGEMVITANYLASYDPYHAGLVWNNIESKEYYQKLVDNGYKYLTFDLAIGGENADKLDDLYLFCGQKVSGIQYENGVYKAKILISDIVRVYDAIEVYIPNGERKGQTGSRHGMFLAWRDNRGTDMGTWRKYIFTISNSAYVKE